MPLRFERLTGGPPSRLEAGAKFSRDVEISQHAEDVVRDSRHVAPLAGTNLDPNRRVAEIDLV